MCKFHESTCNDVGDIWLTDNPIYFSSIDIVEHDFDIICFTETSLSGNDAATIAVITPDGYDFRHLRRRNRRGGGVGI